MSRNRKDTRASARASYIKQIRKEVRLRENIRRNTHGDAAKEAAALSLHGLTSAKNNPVDIGSRAERKRAQIKRRAKHKAK
jgi:hypothetical protein